MSDNLTETLHSLRTLMAQETRMLTEGGWPVDIAALTSAKLRLVGTLEALVAARERASSDWLERLSPEERSTLLSATEPLRDIAAGNAAIIGRQIDLSRDLLAAIAAEARRLGGAQSHTYRASGRVQQRDGSAPVAINTRL